MSESSGLDVAPKRPAPTVPPGALAALLAALTIAAYVPALSAGYIWDDDFYLTNNRNITSPQGLWRSWSQVTGPGANPQYYPMVFTTFWLEFRVWGVRAFGYHFDNVILHAANAALLWIALRRLRVPGAWFAAALFALHPVNVESVAWITERKNVLSTFFYLLALLAYMRFSRLDGADASRSDVPARWAWYPLALVLFALALFSKTVACSLPAAILLLLWWKRDRVRAADLIRLAPFFALGLALAMVTSYVEQHHVRAKDLLLNLTPLHRVLLAGRAVWFYLSKLLWPSPLIFMYPRWTLDPRSIAQFAYPLGVVGLLAVLWQQRRRIGKGPLVAALIYAGTLVPALGFFDVYPMRYSWVADHFQYLAGIAPLAVFAALCCDRMNRATYAAVRIVAIVLLGILTFRQAMIYHDPITLWRETLAKNDDAWMAHTNLAAQLLRSKRPEHLAEARRHLERAIAINPDHTQAYNNLAYLALTGGDPASAIEYCERAMRVPNAELLEVFNNYGLGLYELGRDDEAVPYFEKSLRVRADFVPARVNLSRTLLRLGRFDDARKNLDVVFRIAPRQAEAHLLLAEALLNRGRINDGLEQLRVAADCSPTDLGLCFKLSKTLQAAGRTPDAIVEARRLVRMAPRRADAHALLGGLLLSAGQTDEAVRELREAQRINPADPDTRQRLEEALRAGSPKAPASGPKR